jgi:hypothetical protein
MKRSFDQEDDREPKRRRKDWISATATRNYMLKDPLLDFLSFHSSNRTSSSDSNVHTSYNFTEYIMQRGLDFEKEIVEQLKCKFGDDMVCIQATLPTNWAAFETKKHLDNKTPIIYGGCLKDEEECLHGIPDLIVRADYINKLVTKEAEQNPSDNEYRIVDIKFSTLQLRADGTHLLNAGSFPAFKAQLFVYDHMLRKICDNTSKKAYILGRRWKYATKGETHKGRSPFSRLGTIDFSTVDLDYVKRTKDAITWIKNLRAHPEWKVLPVPSVPELYPNMSNYYDHPFHEEKKRIAKQLAEITTLWMCGVKNRQLAHKQDVYRWDDDRCTPSLLGINGTRAPILERIIQVNKQNIERLPRVIKDNSWNWKEKYEDDLFVDFETVSDIFHDGDGDLIYLIGVGWVENDKWQYRKFLASELTREQEECICDEFLCFIYSFPNARCFHWSAAEPRIFEKSVENYHRHLIRKASKIQWIDVLQIFKREPIAIGGAFCYSLGEIADALRKWGRIKADWDDGNIIDGTSAMVAISCEKEITCASKIVREIVKYNETDCHVLFEILEYLRKDL